MATISNTSEIAEGFYKEKSSKFLSFAHHVESIDEAKAIVAKYKKEHHKARHVCFAYRLGADGSIYRAADDGEPAGTAGKPILKQLEGAGLTNSMVVVVRYFGGTLLGTGGLVRAYKEAAADALSHAKIID
ncbi:MAG: YigZ family protein [Paludibacteraceae bacterium]|nr:YigZ family protein [Paludibacteraceae bacterium]MBQ1851082.1 YigZ family protein [Paludibacteraceae bacterium]MBQ2065363.1 YigZ family protein [Paludibacteraceae bacterium]